MDGWAAGAAALEFAFAEASLRGVGLRAAHAWNSPIVGCGPFALQSAQDTAAGSGACWPRLWPGGVGRYPEVKVSEQLEHGHPVDVLTEVSARAGLLVLGSRGRGGLKGLLLGSVSHSMLHHAACPVVVTQAPTAPEHP